jgi:hypothetical protein
MKYLKRLKMFDFSRRLAEYLLRPNKKECHATDINREARITGYALKTLGRIIAD